MCDTTKECIRAALEGAGTAVAADAIDACVRLAQWMAPKAARLGLTQFDTAADIAEQLIGPGVGLVPHLAARPVRALEVGAGSGALGLSLAMLCPTAAVTLLDRRARAASFIDIGIKRFAVANAQAVRGDFRTHRQRYDWVIARAVDPEEGFIGRLLPLCQPGGTIALLQSQVSRCLPANVVHAGSLKTCVADLSIELYRCGDG